MAGFDILNIVGDPWNDADSVFGGIAINVTDTASRYNSTFLECLLNDAPVFSIWKNGETVISNADGTSLGGIGLRGNYGEMALTSQIDPNSGVPASVVRWYWEGANIGSMPDSVAVLRGMGNNRLSIESNGAITHISKSGRYEFETEHQEAPLQFVGYRAASADGRPILFNNHNQTAYAASVVQIGVDNNVHHALQIGRWDGRDFTANAYFDGSGGLYARSVSAYGPSGIFRGITARATGAVTASAFMGVDRNDVPFLGFGTGAGPLDAYLYRAGPNLFSIGGVGTSATPAIKGSGNRLQGRLGDDSDFCSVQGKLTTDQVAASGTVTPDSTLTLYDANGTAYLVPCVAA